MQAAAAAVQAVREARKRITFDTKKSFFGAYDFWTYIAEGPIDTNCDKCTELDAQDFTGSQLRSMFPDLIVLDDDTIYPNVHQTLWGKDTCKCILRRVTDGLDPTNFVAYEGDKLEPYQKDEG